MDFKELHKQKYFKYKNKYIDLKKKFNQEGGVDTTNIPKLDLEDFFKVKINTGEHLNKEGIILKTERVIVGSGLSQNIYINAIVQVIDENDSSVGAPIVLKLIGDLRPNINNYVKMVSDDNDNYYGIVKEEWMSNNEHNLEEKCPDNEQTEETFRVYKVILASSNSLFQEQCFKADQVVLSIPKFKKGDYVYNSTPKITGGEKISQVNYASVKYNNKKKVSEIAYIDELERYDLSDNFTFSTPLYHVQHGVELLYIDPSGDGVSRENSSKWSSYRGYNGRITGITKDDDSGKYIITFNNCNNLEFKVGPNEKLFSLSNTARLVSTTITCPKR